MANTFVTTISTDGGVDISGGVDSIIQSPSLTWTITFDDALDNVENISTLVGKDITIAGASSSSLNGTHTITVVDTSAKLFVKVVIAGSSGFDDEFSPSSATFLIPDVVLIRETITIGVS